MAAVALILGIPAQAHGTEQLFPNDESMVEFVTPSGNTGCIYIPASPGGGG